jgi:hypothetical protein
MQATLLVCFASAAGASPSNEEMARCAAVAAPETRLVCYDALAHRAADKTASVAAPAIRSGVSSGAVVANEAEAIAPTGAAPTAAAPTAAAPTATEASAGDPRNFGLTAVQQHTADLGPKSIAARISIVSSDQNGRVYIVLDSGQTWTVLDNDGRLAAGDAVTIKRAALASFLMMTPSNHSYRVRRVKYTSVSQSLYPGLENGEDRRQVRFVVAPLCRR